MSAQLISEKSAAKAAKDAEDKAYAASLLEMDDMKKQLEGDAIAARADTNVAVAEYQLAQASAKRERERAQQVSELGDNVAEIQGALSSSTLTEDPSVGTSYIAAHRARPDHYKGMPFESQQAILAEQSAQREYKAAADARAKSEKVASDAELEHARRIGCYTDAQARPALFATPDPAVRPSAPRALTKRSRRSLLAGRAEARRGARGSQGRELAARSGAARDARLHGDQGLPQRHLRGLLLAVQHDQPLSARPGRSHARRWHRRCPCIRAVTPTPFPRRRHCCARSGFELGVLRSSGGHPLLPPMTGKHRA